MKMSAGNYEVRSPGASTKLLALTAHAARLRARSALIWSLVLGALGAMFVALYPSIADRPGMEQLIDSMPQAMRDIAGFGDSVGFSSVESFLATEMLNFLAPLALSFFPILAASSAIAGSEEDGTLDVLMGNPLSRWQLVAGRFLAAAVLLLGIVCVMGLIMWLAAILVGVDLSLGSAAAGTLNLWPLCMLFGGVALLCSALAHRRLLAVAVPVALLFSMYFVDALANTVEALEFFQPLSAFYYYGSAIENGLDWANFAGLTAVTAALVLLAILVFRRRDIYT